MLNHRERQTTLGPTGLILCEFQAPFRQVGPTVCYSQNNTFHSESGNLVLLGKDKIMHQGSVG